MTQETTKKKFIFCNACGKRIYEGEPVITACLDEYGLIFCHSIIEFLDCFEVKNCILDSEKHKQVTSTKIL